MEYVKTEENVCGYFSRHPYKNLLKFKELIYYFNFNADDATPNALFIDLNKKFTKNDKSLRQIIKLARQNNFKLNKPLTFLKYIENRNIFQTLFEN